MFLGCLRRHLLFTGTLLAKAFGVLSEDFGGGGITWAGYPRHHAVALAI